MRLDYCYHTHTYRCGHATGTDEEYVVRAIELGIKRLGFSDHVILPEGVDGLGIRGRYDQLDDYLSSIKYLKEKYKDQIEILVGFEAEYIPSVLDYYKSLLKEKIDYLILGQHLYMEDGICHWHFNKDSGIEDVRRYVDCVIEGIKTGLFTYLCHPDLFMSSQDNWNKELEVEARRLLKACEECNIPIEYNLCGTRRKTYDGYHRSYPNYEFFKLVKDYNLKLVIGMDAHSPDNFNQFELDKAEEFLKALNLDFDRNYRIK